MSDTWRRLVVLAIGLAFVFGGCGEYTIREGTPAGTYQIVRASDSGAWRLNTRTGTMSFCVLSSEVGMGVVCTSPRGDVGK